VRILIAKKKLHLLLGDKSKHEFILVGLLTSFKILPWRLIDMTVALNQQSYPLMMHLSILPKYDAEIDEVSYDPATQTSTIQGMAGSWSTASNSTGGVFKPSDDDSWEDD
jgi:hypothetical protein